MVGCLSRGGSLKVYRLSLQILHGYLKKLYYYMVSLHLMQGIPVESLQYQIPCKYYNGNQTVDISKIQGLQVPIHAIPINLKSLYSDFPVESL